MSMAMILAEMPDVLERTLREHVADGHGRCAECRDAAGRSAAWPCLLRRMADEARHIQAGGPRGHRRGRPGSAPGW